MRKTKIICTIGPASLPEEVLQKMHKAGMNGARINTAYGNLRQYKQIVDNVRKIADIPVIVDIKGPEVRLSAKQKTAVTPGDVLEIGFNREDISFNHNFYDEMRVGDELYIDNGKIRTRVIEKKGESCTCWSLPAGN